MVPHTPERLPIGRRMKLRVRRVVGPRLSRRLKGLRVRLGVLLGHKGLARPGLDGLDVTVANALGWSTGGVFVEFGANDGLQQSNTFLLETELDWRGVLVEPLTDLAAEAQRNRPSATVICAAVLDDERRGKIVSVSDSGLRSAVGDIGKPTAAVTLGEVLRVAYSQHGPITLVSVDVEGSEVAALQSVSRIPPEHLPMWILVETSSPEAVDGVLGARFERVKRLTHHDWLYRSIAS